MSDNATTSPTERRLRAVIESAPVSLIVVSVDTKVLAANQAALSLLGAASLDDVRGHELTSFVSPRDREAVAYFVRRVCYGQSGSLEYELLGPGDVRRAVATRAVPAWREGSAPAVFLGATWEVTAATRSTPAPQEILQELAEIRRAHGALRDEHERLMATLRAERDALEAQIADLQRRCGELTAQRDADRRERDAAKDYVRSELAKVLSTLDDSRRAVGALLNRLATNPMPDGEPSPSRSAAGAAGVVSDSAPSESPEWGF
jgi:cell division protein FtsB